VSPPPAGDHDAVGAAHQHTGDHAIGLDGEALVDSQGAEPARIEDVDLAADRGLHDGARERLAGCGSAAGIGVVAETRNPGPRGLRMGGGGADQQREEYQGENA